jgi:hypothetical protein
MPFIICFDDQCGFTVPMGWDKSCAGAVCCISEKDEVVMFADKPAARKALLISGLWARLQKEQGIPCCEEFLGKQRDLRIVPVVFAEGFSP